MRARASPPPTEVRDAYHHNQHRDGSTSRDHAGLPPRIDAGRPTHQPRPRGDGPPRPPLGHHRPTPAHPTRPPPAPPTVHHHHPPVASTQHYSQRTADPHRHSRHAPTRLPRRHPAVA